MTSLFFSAACAMALAGLAGQTPQGKIESFKGATVGQLPAGWKVGKTGSGTGGEWRIVEDKEAFGGLALAQLRNDPGATFNLCVKSDGDYKDVDLTIGFKAMAGNMDQGGGPVWRLEDGDNYYVARMNPLESNFRLYKVVAGKRIQLATADVKAEAGKWHTIRVVHTGKHMHVSFNGKQYFHMNDETFQDAGKIGFWNKADAQTRFALIAFKGS